MFTIADLHQEEELSSERMSQVAGGTDNKPVVDASTPNLFLACCNGKHFAEATITL
jgi:type VI protein secretion system component Hcp